jgi:hypothetical protein
MRPLVKVAAGLAVAVVDVRLGGLDVLPDPVAWVVVANGLGALSLPLARSLAWLAAGLAFGEVWVPVRDGIPLDPAGPRLVAALLYGLAVLVTVWVALDGLERRAAGGDDPRAAEHLRLLRLLTVVPAALATVGSAAGVPVVAGLAGLVAVVAYLATVVMVGRLADRPWAQPGVVTRA